MFIFQLTQVNVTGRHCVRPISRFFCFKKRGCKFQIHCSDGGAILKEVPLICQNYGCKPYFLRKKFIIFKLIRPLPLPPSHPRYMGIYPFVPGDPYTATSPCAIKLTKSSRTPTWQCPKYEGCSKHYTAATVRNIIRQPLFETLYGSHCSKHYTTATVRNIIRQPLFETLYGSHCSKHYTTATVRNIIRQPLFETLYGSHCSKHYTTATVRNIIRQPLFETLYDNHCSKHYTTATVRNIIRQPLFETLYDSHCSKHYTCMAAAHHKSYDDHLLLRYACL